MSILLYNINQVYFNKMAFQDKNHYRVYRIDGMKINKNHFIDLENALTQFSQVIGSQKVNTTNYGLLPDVGTDDSVKINFSIDGQDTIKVQLIKCKAITVGGNLIYITPEITDFLERSNQIIKADYTIKGPEE